MVETNAVLGNNHFESSKASLFFMHCIQEGRWVSWPSTDSVKNADKVVAVLQYSR